MPAADLTITGTIKAKEFTLTYVLDGAQYGDVETVAFGTELTIRPNPEKEGFIFSGWEGFPADSKMPAHDVTVIGSFIETFTITFIFGPEVIPYPGVPDGSNLQEIINALIAEHGDTYKTPEYIYTLTGWEEEPLPETVTENLTLTATFDAEPQQYELKYLLNGVVQEPVEIVAYGTELTIREEPAAPEGFEFSGWLGVPEDGKMPAADLTITGSFIPKEYKLTYLLDGDVDYEAMVAFGTELTLRPDPDEREGYTFSGWSELPETMPAEDVTVTGSFIPKEYKLTYKVDGKQVGDVETIAFGSLITPREKPEKEGYVFVGWIGLPETMPAKNVTVYGYLVQLYTVTFKLGNGTWSYSDVPQGTDVQELINTAKEEHGDRYETSEGLWILSGWEEEPLPETVTGNMTLTAKYVLEASVFKLTYYLNGDVYASFDVKYGDPITPLAPPPASLIPEGMKFSGWVYEPPTMPAKDWDVTGTLTELNICTIILHVDDDDVTFFEIEKGEPLSSVVEQWLEDVGHKYSNGCKNYTITGWAEELPETAIENATYHATFTEEWIIYTITFRDYDGTVLYSQDVHCGQIPEYDGEQPYREPETIVTGEDHSWKDVEYDFLGWSPNIETVKGPESPMTYTATYSERTIATEVEKVENEKTYRKVMENGVLYIYVGGMKFDSAGRRIE